MVDIGAARLFWSGDGSIRVGLGEARRIPVDRAGGAAGATAAQDELADLGDDAVAFGAFAFDPRSAGELIVPEAIVTQDHRGARWLTVVGERLLSEAEVIDRFALGDDRDDPAAAQPTTYTVTSVQTPEHWRDQVVAAVRDRIRAGELTKTVLARELVLTADQPLDVTAVVERLVGTHPAANVFAVDGFVGASPELLVARSGHEVRAHPLAGTLPRASDPATDEANANALLGSAKDRWEHRITIEWLLEELLPFCSYIDAEPEPTIVSLPNVHHLGTRVEGRLSDPAASVLELVAALHPTPAVGGAPQADALALIEELEGADRGRYAGPVGWVDGAGNGSFAVAIRSATIDGYTARLFAGVGVVADSDPEAELAETRAKFRAMLLALLQP